MDYKTKLQSPKWQKKRLEILERDDFTCRLCGDDETQLQIHHLKYSRGNPWDIDNENLVTLCSVCHNEISVQKIKCTMNDIDLGKIKALKTDFQNGETVLLLSTEDNTYFTIYDGFDRINNYTYDKKDTLYIRQTLKR